MSIMWRKFASNAFVLFCGLSVLIALVPLAFILFFVLSQGLQALNVEFFTSMPKPVGEPGGGMANSIVGTLILVGLGSLFAIPIGILSGVYMAEYAGSRFASAIRFAADTLNGVPSIVVGVFVYGIAVLPFKQFSAFAGGLALGIMMIPIIARTTEELLVLVPSTMREGALALGATRARAVFSVVLPFKQFSAFAGGLALGIMMIPIIARTTEELLVLVPSTMREGALALGATRARAVFSVVLPAAAPGIITGVVLALARIAGETAPLLFTAFNNRFFTTDLTQPISSLTVQVFTYAISPYDDWHRQAWAGALVLVLIVLVCSILARVATRRIEGMVRN